MPYSIIIMTNMFSHTQRARMTGIAVFSVFAFMMSLLAPMTQVYASAFSWDSDTSYYSNEWSYYEDDYDWYYEEDDYWYEEEDYYSEEYEYYNGSEWVPYHGDTSDFDEWETVYYEEEWHEEDTYSESNWYYYEDESDWSYEEDDYWYEEESYYYDEESWYTGSTQNCENSCSQHDYDDCGEKPVVTTLSATSIDEDSAQLRCHVDPNDDTTDVWFEWGTSSSYLNYNTSDIVVSYERDVEKAITSLNDNTTYYYRCVGENEHGTDYGSVKSFRTDEGYTPPEGDAPEIATKAATNIDSDSATLRCYADPNDDTTDVWFEWGTSSSNLNEKTSDVTVNIAKNVERTIYGLDEDENYYYRCVGENEYGTDYGSVKSFTTDEDEPDADRPSVDTISATDIDEDSATLRCDVNPNNDDTDVWFEYGEDSGMDDDTPKRSIGDGNDEERVSRSISGLDEDTKYYFRCVAENNEGKTYGDTETLYTDDNGGSSGDRPDVETLSAKDVDEDSATLRCDVEINADEAEIWFEYGEDSGMDEDTSKRTIDDDDNEYERTVTGLDEDEKYYFRCVAENDEGKTYGDTKTFTTDDDNNDGDRPDVETLSATDITEDSARLRCDVDPNDSDTDVWFEYGETTSMNDDTYKQYVDGDDRSERVDKIISNLDAHTIYYYRCVADNDEGKSYGSMKSFNTDDGGYTDGRAPDALTNAAFNVGRTSARFVGTASIPSSARTIAWFEWGTSFSLGRTTASQSVGNGPSALVEHSQFSLAYNTTYYYRLVVQNTYGIDRGNIVSFTTLPEPYDPTPRPEPEPEPEYDLRVMKSVENLDIANGTDTDILAERGQLVRFTIEVRNTGNETLSETEITDLVPFYLEFANAEEQLAYDDPQREVVWYVGDLRPGEREVVTLDMVVTTDARTGMSIENIARVESEEYAESSNSVYVRVSDDVQEDDRYDRAAAGLFLGWDGFFPTTFVGWLLLAILLLILVILIRMIVGYYNEHKAKKASEEATKMAMMAGRGDGV
jgi:uncharacterized repeat protein (TIGR01451 family)